MYAFCIGMDLSGNNKGKEICYVHQEYICQRISDEQIVLCRICTDADSAYGNKDQTCKAENQRDCRDQGQEVCGILLLYFAGRQDHICIYCVPCIYASFGPGGKCGGGTSGSYLQRAGSHVYRPIFAGQADSQKAGDPDGSSTGVVQAYASGQFGNGSPRCMEKNSDYRRACII